MNLKINVESSIEIMCDNQAVTAIANNPNHHDRIKQAENDRFNKQETRRRCNISKACSFSSSDYRYSH